MSLICLVTAMTAEAHPLVETFKLRALPQRGLKAWIGDGVCLLQTGMGAQRAAARLDTLLTIQSGIDAFINVGIAGGDRPIGDVILAESITDATSGRCWYPHLPPPQLTPNIEHCAVVSVPEPCTDYRRDRVYDMEAAAVVNFAAKQTDLSRIHALKVISDNCEQPLSDFSVKIVNPLVRKTIPSVEALINDLSTASHANTTANFKQQVQVLTEHIVGVCHHSVTDTHRLRRLLERYLALYGELPNVEQLGHLESSRHLLQRLEIKVSRYPLVY